MLSDMSQEVPRHLGVWHMFLVSDVPLACIYSLQFFAWRQCCPQCKQLGVSAICFRLGHMYNYSFELFRKKLIGEDGALWFQM